MVYYRCGWRDGGIHQISTPQTQMHELYCKYMNLVDIHNKLRQGQCSMANVWKTTSWSNRHFAEMLGFAEVNMYKSLSFFIKDKWAAMSHNDFRRRLAWVFLTLGKEPFLEDVLPDDSSSTSMCTWTPSLVGSASTTLFSGPQDHRQVWNFYWDNEGEATPAATAASTPLSIASPASFRDMVSSVSAVGSRSANASMSTSKGWL